MKKYVVIIFILFFQKGYTQYSSFYLGISTNPLILFADENVFVSDGANLNTIIKTDFSGNVIWTKKGNLLPAVFKNNFIYCISYDTIHYGYSGLVKMDTSGNIIWSKDLSASIFPLVLGNINGVGSIAVNENRIYLLSSQYDTISYTSMYGGVITLDTSGNYENAWCDTTGIGGAFISSCKSANDGAWIIYRYPGIGYEEGLFKLDTNGNYDTNSVSSYLDVGVSIKTLDIFKMPDSTYLVYSYVYPSGQYYPSDNKIFMMKIHENGSVAWAKKIESQTSADTSFMPQAATCDSAGNVYMIGLMGTNFGSDNRVIAMKFDSSGNLLFTKKWNYNYPISIKQLYFKNNFIYAGALFTTAWCPAILTFDTSFSSCSLSDTAILLPVYDEQIPQSMQGLQTSRPYGVLNNTFQLSVAANINSFDLCTTLSNGDLREDKSISISPNPFSELINVKSNQFRDGVLSIYDLVGVKVYECELKSDLELNLSGYKPGVYMFELTSGTFREVKKVIKL